MSYSDFDLKKIKSTFNIAIMENDDLFSSIPEVESSDLLTQLLKQSVPLALAMGTEKACAELIIINIFLEIKRQLMVSFFSGIEFTVDKELGLNEFCDFIISKSPEQLFLESPIIVIVEAKNERITSGLGQCIAEIIAAKRYNEKDGKALPFIYGVVTTGHAWKFLKLADNSVYIDIVDYYINNPNKILGILTRMIKG
jgi:hypothetical protein